MINFQIIIAIYIFIKLFAMIADPRSKILALLTVLSVIAVFALTVDMFFLYVFEFVGALSTESETYYY
jgi:hypothetical protein